jgi:nucleoside-diphosphate-sugar epimerase
MPRKILVTGATGALGPQLAAELLAAGAEDQVCALVRSTGISAPHRFERWVKTVCAIGQNHSFKDAGDCFVMPDTEAIDASRLHLIAGDVTEDGLGLDAAARRELARDTEVIIHAAADTKFRGSAEAQWDVNVEGTRRMLEFAASCPRLRQFILVSTICVAGKSRGKVPETFFAPDGFVNQYERTKWEAERLALASALPLRIARVGIVMGSRENGAVHRLGALHHVLRWFGRGLIPLVPGTPQSSVELIDVEMACQFLARAASEEAIERTPDKTIWHVTAGRRATPLEELMEFTWEQFSRSGRGGGRRGERGRIVNADTFERLRRASESRGDLALGHLIESIDSFLPGLLYPRSFDTTQAEQLWGGELPVADWRQTLGRVIAFIEAGARQKRAEVLLSA